MDAKNVKDIADFIASKPGISLADAADVFEINPTQIPALIARAVRNGDRLGLSDQQLMTLSANLKDKALDKVIQHQIGKPARAENRSENKTSRSPGQLADSLEALHKRLSDRILKGKPKSKLVSGRKTKMPGFSTFFRKDV